MTWFQIICVVLLFMEAISIYIENFLEWKNPKLSKKLGTILLYILSILSVIFTAGGAFGILKI